MGQIPQRLIPYFDGGYLASNQEPPFAKIPAPNAGIFDYPQTRGGINSDWASILLGELDELSQPQRFQGDETTQNTASQQIEEYLLMLSQPSIEVRWMITRTNNTTPAANSVISVPFNSKPVDTQNIYTTTFQYLVIPVKGVYTMNLNLSAGSINLAALDLNGTYIASIAPSGNGFATISVTAEFEVDDIIAPIFRVSAGTLQGGNGRSFFSGCLLYAT